MKPLILVIEEFEILRAQLDEMLSDAGYRVRLAKTLPEGIAQIQQQKYEAILLDVACCPDGLTQPFETESPVLFTTTKSHREKADRFLQNRASDCINKPFNKVEVLTKVARAIKPDQIRTFQNGDKSGVIPEVLAESKDIHRNEQPQPIVRGAGIALCISQSRKSRKRALSILNVYNNRRGTIELRATSTIEFWSTLEPIWKLSCQAPADEPYNT